MFALKSWPTPILVLNLDRALTEAHLAVLNDRAEHIYVKNLREDLMAIDHLSALRVRDEIESTITESLDWLRGGTVVLDGGSMYRSILKLADRKIAKDIAEGTRWNPRDKEHVNAYFGAFISRVADQGVNLIITAHAAWAWEVGDHGLTKTTKLYPKLDDIASERTAASILMLKRCECGRNIVNQDGTCTGEGLPNVSHEGRRHVARIVNNKYNTATEGSEWENFGYNQLRALCFDPKVRAVSFDLELMRKVVADACE